jgi:hypothetical protein
MTRESTRERPKSQVGLIIDPGQCKETIVIIVVLRPDLRVDSRLSRIHR